MLEAQKIACKDFARCVPEMVGSMNVTPTNSQATCTPYKPDKPENLPNKMRWHWIRAKKAPQMAVHPFFCKLVNVMDSSEFSVSSCTDLTQFMRNRIMLCHQNTSSTMLTKYQHIANPLIKWWSLQHLPLPKMDTFLHWWQCLLPHYTCWENTPTRDF